MLKVFSLGPVAMVDEKDTCISIDNPDTV